MHKQVLNKSSKVKPKDCYRSNVVATLSRPWVLLCCRVNAGTVHVGLPETSNILMNSNAHCKEFIRVFCRVNVGTVQVGLPETSNSVMNSMLLAMRSGISAVGRRMGVSLPLPLRKVLEGIDYSCY